MHKIKCQYYSACAQMYSCTCSDVCTNTSLQTHALGAYEKHVNISWAHLHKCKNHVNSPLQYTACTHTCHHKTHTHMDTHTKTYLFQTFHFPLSNWARFVVIDSLLLRFKNHSLPLLAFLLQYMPPQSYITSLHIVTKYTLRLERILVLQA